MYNVGIVMWLVVDGNIDGRQRRRVNPLNMNIKYTRGWLDGISLLSYNVLHHCRLYILHIQFD